MRGGCPVSCCTHLRCIELFCTVCKFISNVVMSIITVSKRLIQLGINVSSVRFAALNASAVRMNQLSNTRYLTTKSNRTLTKQNSAHNTSSHYISTIVIAATMSHGCTTYLGAGTRCGSIVMHIQAKHEQMIECLTYWTTLCGPSLSCKLVAYHKRRRHLADVSWSDASTLDETKSGTDEPNKWHH